MNESRNVPKSLCRLHERIHALARGRIDRRDTYFVSDVAQDFCGRIGVVQPHVGQQDVLADTNATRDGLTDLTRSDDDNDLTHGSSSLEQMAQ